MTHEQLRNALMNEFMIGKDVTFDSLSESEKDILYIRLGFCHRALLNAGLLESVRSEPYEIMQNLSD